MLQGEARAGTVPIGAAAVAATGDPLPAETRSAVQRADAVLLGAVGDPSLDKAPRHLRPETALLALRALLGVYANLRPVAVHAVLADRSPLKPERLHGVDLLIVRELTGDCTTGSRGRATRPTPSTRSPIPRRRSSGSHGSPLRRRAGGAVS